MNKVYLLGHVGQDPEMKYTPSGTAVLSFTLATKERRGDATETQWHQCQIYGKFAETMQGVIKKGVEIFCEGKVWSREWTDKTNTKRKSTEIIVGTCRVSQTLRQVEEQNGARIMPKAEGVQDDYSAIQ